MMKGRSVFKRTNLAWDDAGICDITADEAAGASNDLITLCAEDCRAVIGGGRSGGGVRDWLPEERGGGAVICGAAGGGSSSVGGEQRGVGLGGAVLVVVFVDGVTDGDDVVVLLVLHGLMGEDGEREDGEESGGGIHVC